MKLYLFARISRRVALILGGLALVASAYADVQTINHCTTIDKPGSYRLQKVITAAAGDLEPALFGFPACIRVAADFVTLDLQGYTIVGPGSGVGIATVGEHNALVIRNGALTNFQFGLLMAGDAIEVKKLRTIANTGRGIELNGNGNSVRDSVASGNGGAGILLFSGTAAGHSVIGNVSVKNGGQGIFVQCPAVVLQNVAAGNSLTNILTTGLCTTLENNPLP